MKGERWKVEGGRWKVEGVKWKGEGGEGTAKLADEVSLAQSLWNNE